MSRFFVMLNWFTSDEIEVVIFTELIRGNNLKIMFFELYSFQSKRATVSLYLVKIYFINIYFRAREKSYVVLTQHRRTLETPSSSGNREFYPIPHFFFLNASVNSLFVHKYFRAWTQWIFFSPPLSHLSSRVPSLHSHSFSVAACSLIAIYNVNRHGQNPLSQDRKSRFRS